jgi:hypothetical protein
MSYKYQEPSSPDFEVLPAGEYDFVVVGVEDPYVKNGNFILPIKIQIKGCNVTVFDYPSAGRTKKDNKPYDTIAPFLKAIRRNPAVDEEPDFSAKNLIGAKGTAKLKIEEYQGVKNNKVHFYVYDREQTTATVSRGPAAQPKSYNQPAGETRPLSTAASAPDDDNIPF